LQGQLAALSEGAYQRWLTYVRQRLAAGEPIAGLGWRALVDVRREYPPPDGWVGDGFPRTKQA